MNAVSFYANDIQKDRTYLGGMNMEMSEIKTTLSHIEQKITDFRGSL